MDENVRTAPPGSTVTSDRTATLVVGAMMGGLVLLGGVLLLLGAELVAPPTWAVVLVVAATAGMWATVLLARTSAPVTLPPGGGPADIPARSVVPVVVLRAAVLEAPALIGLVLAVLADPMNLTIYLLPAVVAVAGMALLARPAVVRERLARDAVARTAGTTR